MVKQYENGTKVEQSCEIRGILYTKPEGRELLIQHDPDTGHNLDRSKRRIPQSGFDLVME